MNAVELGSPQGLGALWYRMRQCPVAREYMPLVDTDVEGLDRRLAQASTNFDPSEAKEKYFGVRVVGQWVGLVGCRDVSPMMRYAEVNYMVDAPYRGCGYATAAVSVLIDQLFSHGFRKLGILVDAGNLASITVARRNKFTLEGILRAHYLIGGEPRDQLVFGRLQPELRIG
jgi:ribosomal-protein-alanine N-acetyltransferase